MKLLPQQNEPIFLDKLSRLQNRKQLFYVSALVASVGNILSRSKERNTAFNPKNYYEFQEAQRMYE